MGIKKYSTSLNSPLTAVETNRNNFNSKRHTNYFSQSYWLTKRYIKRKSNDLDTLAIQIGQSVIIAFLIRLIFKDLDQVVLFFIVISAIWFGTNNAAKEIVSEINIFKRERMYNQGIIPYIFSKLIVLSSIGLVQSFIFIKIISDAYVNSYLPFTSPINIIFWMFGITIVSTLLGLAISALSSSAEKVMGIIPIVLIPQIMLSGILVKMSTLFIKTLSFLMISRWGMTGISRIQTEIVSHVESPRINSLAFLRGNLGATYDFYVNNTFEVFILIIQGIIFFIFIYFILKLRFRNQ